MASKARSGSDLVQTITANTSAPANTINIAANGQISVNNNIIPSTNITYDLGTNLLRWRDLYLSGQTIQLGNTTISTTGNNLVLPTNTVLGGNLDLNSKNITGTGDISFNGELTLGSISYYTKQYVLQGITTNATETEILIGGSTRIPVPTDTTMFYEVSIVARRTDATGESASWHIKGCADNFSDTVADVGNLYEIAVAQDDVSWAVDILADDTNNAINMLVTGAASKTIRWTAVVKTIEVAE